MGWLIASPHRTPSTGCSFFLPLTQVDFTRQQQGLFLFFPIKSDAFGERRWGFFSSCFPFKTNSSFSSNLHDKDVLYFFSIQFSPFSCFSSLSKIRHFEVFWAGEVKLLFASESILFSIKRNFSTFWKTTKLLCTTQNKPYSTMEVSKSCKIKYCLVYCFCWECYLYAHCGFSQDPQEGGREAENNFNDFH